MKFKELRRKAFVHQCKARGGAYRVIVSSLLLFGSSQAASVPIGWTPNAISDPAGYRVYCGADAKDVGKVTSYTLSGLVEGATYPIWVTSYNAFGESAPSATLTYTVPIPAQTPCAYTISPIGTGFASAGGSGTVMVTTGKDCTWVPSNLPGWVSASTTPRTGTAPFAFIVATNNSFDRTATIIVAGKPFLITQNGKKGKK